MSIAILHHLKVHPDPFRAILAGQKRADFRRIDRPIRPGDLVLLSEWEPDASPSGGHFTGGAVLVQCTHLQEGEQYGIPAGHGIYSWDVMAATRPVQHSVNLETAVR